MHSYAACTTCDYHSNFERRLDNYIVGRRPVVLTKPGEVEQAREETLDVLADVFGKRADRLFEITGRWRRLDEKQIEKIVSWMKDIKFAHSSKR